MTTSSGRPDRGEAASPPIPAHAALAADVLAVLTSATSLRAALQGCAEAVVMRVDAAFARVWTLNELDRVLELQASAGLYTHLDGDHSRVPVGRFKIGLIADERRPHLTNDVLHDPRVSDPAWAEAEGMVSFAGYPLLAEGRLVGVIALFARHPLSDDTFAALSGVADAVAAGIDRDRANEDRERLLGQLEAQRSLMEAVIQQMPAGLIVAEAPSGRLVLANRQVEAILRQPFVSPGEVGDYHHDGFRPDGRAYEPEQWPLARALRFGQTVVSEEIDYVLGDGTWATLETSAAPVRDPAGAVVAGVATFHDVTDRRRTERRLAAQYAATRVLSEGSTLEGVAAPFVEAVCVALGWEAGSILEVDRDAGVLRSVDTWHAPGVGGSLVGQTRDATFVRGAGLPGRVWESAAPVAVNDMEAESQLPRSDAAVSDGLHAAVAVPVFFADSVLGVFEIFRRGRQPADPDLVQLMVALASQLGQFTERTRAEAAVRAGEARKIAMLETALDCVVSIDHRGLVTEFNPAAEQTFGWRRDEMLGTLMADRIIPPSLRSGHDRGFDHYLRTGEGPVLGRRVELLAQRRDGTEFPIELAVTRIPSEGPPAFTAYIRDITERHQAAQALLASREQFATVARTLQKSLLPPDLPPIAGMELAARYHPAVEGLEVGGDFYDVFRTGRSSWAVVIGDVCGKGAEAASLTGLVRYTIRAAAMQNARPTRILTTLNQAILRQEGALNERFATVAYASVSRRGGGTILTVACGGHPPPLLVRPDGEVAAAGAAGTLLGALPEPEMVEVTVRLAPGDKVVFHTDGVTEAPGPGGEFGARRLRALLETCGGLDAAGTAARLEQVVLAHQGGVSRDDMAILVLGVDPR